MYVRVEVEPATVWTDATLTSLYTSVQSNIGLGTTVNSQRSDPRLQSQ